MEYVNSTLIIRPITPIHAATKSVPNFSHELAILKRLSLVLQLLVPTSKSYVFQNALNCWVAALLYLVTLLFSVSQFYLNNRQTYSV